MGPVVVRHLNVSLANWPFAADGLRIAHVSDLHLRTWNRVLKHTQQLLLGLEYDLLAVTGDLSHHPGDWARAAELTRRLFSPLYASCGLFAVLGNHDSPRLAEAPELNLQFLRDEAVSVEYSQTTLAVAGVEQSMTGHGDVEAALAGIAPRTPAVLLAHYPSTVYDVPPGQVSLLLAGHTHGGQIRLPLLGCLWTNDRIPTRLARGLHIVDGTRLHASPGVGLSGPIPVRFRCRPEITMLRLWSLESKPSETVFGLEEVECEPELQKFALPV